MKNFRKIAMLLFVGMMASCSKEDSSTTPVLAVSSISPTSGPKNTTVILTGTSFSPNAADNKVMLNDNPCAINIASSTSLSITIPRGAGSGTISVTVAGVTVQSPPFEYIITPSEASTFAGSTQGFADGTTAQFAFPTNVAVDAVGNVYVADVVNNKIRKISTAGVVTTIAGSTQGFADGTGTAAQFNNPWGVAVDAAGNVYVADTFNNKIRKISPTGVVTTLAGSTNGFTDGTGTTARFEFPTAVSLDGQGNVYVADTFNHKIRKVSPTGVVTTLAGSTQGFAEGTGSAAQFSTPYGIAVDASGNAYVADEGNHKIRKISPTGVVTTLAGSTQGFTDATGTAAQFNAPRGVAADNAGNVYVADMSNHKIRKISPTGVVTTLAGSGTAGFANGAASNVAQFNSPRGVTVDAAGNVYVADYSNHKIRKITQD